MGKKIAISHSETKLPEKSIKTVEEPRKFLENPVKITDEDSWSGKTIKNKKEASKIIKSYRFSSYQYFLGQKRPEDILLDTDLLPIDSKYLKDFDSLAEIWTNSEFA